VVEALAAQGLAGLGQARGARDEAHIEAAEDEDARLARCARHQ